MTTKFGNVSISAIEKEVESQLLYPNLSQKTNYAVACDALNELAKQKYEHESLWEQCCSGKVKEGKLSVEQLRYRFSSD